MKLRWSQIRSGGINGNIRNGTALEVDASRPGSDWEEK
jgi:hypothetical protein